MTKRQLIGALAAVAAAATLAGCASAPPPRALASPRAASGPSAKQAAARASIARRAAELRALPRDADLSPLNAGEQRALMSRGLYLARGGHIRPLPTKKGAHAARRIAAAEKSPSPAPSSDATAARPDRTKTLSRKTSASRGQGHRVSGTVSPLVLSVPSG